MRCMFCDATTFNQDLSGWERSTSGNTSTLGNVENMRSMFYGATNFNNGDSGNNEAKTLNNWNVSSVTTMRTMFYNTAFNQDISGWDVSQVTNMVLMFYNTPFNHTIGQWNVSSVTTMSSMFEKASAFNKDISGWERTGSTVGNVSDMSFMFYSSAFNQPIEIGTSSVTTMKGMFSTDGSSYVPFNQDISNWERTGSTVGNVNDMSFMFYGSAFNNGDSGNNGLKPLNNWNVSSVTTMKGMFSTTTNGPSVPFNQDISGWERTGSTVGNVNDMSFMFYKSAFNQPIGNWNVSNVNTMESTFNNAGAFNQDLSGWDQTSPITIVVTVISQSDGNKYVLNGDLTTVPVFNMGHTYIFDMSDSSNTGHPLVIELNGSTASSTNGTSWTKWSNSYVCSIRTRTSKYILYYTWLWNG